MRTQVSNKDYQLKALKKVYKALKRGVKNDTLEVTDISFDITGGISYADKADSEIYTHEIVLKTYGRLRPADIIDGL